MDRPQYLNGPDSTRTPPSSSSTCSRYTGPETRPDSLRHPGTTGTRDSCSVDEEPTPAASAPATKNEKGPTGDPLRAPGLYSSTGPLDASGRLDAQGGRVSYRLGTLGASTRPVRETLPRPTGLGGCHRIDPPAGPVGSDPIPTMPGSPVAVRVWGVSSSGPRED